MTESLTLTQQVAAPRERVWAAWTDVAGLATWWWPQLPDTTYAFEARVGGAYRFRSEAAGIGVHGSVVTLEEPALLELTWVWEDGDVEGPEERVRVTFAEHEGGTRVTVEHRVADAASVAGYHQGWADCLARLAPA